MLYLKKINYEDIEEEYKAIKSIPDKKMDLKINIMMLQKKNLQMK